MFVVSLLCCDRLDPSWLYSDRLDSTLFDASHLGLKRLSRVKIWPTAAHYILNKSKKVAVFGTSQPKKTFSTVFEAPDNKKNLNFPSNESISTENRNRGDRPMRKRFDFPDHIGDGAMFQAKTIVSGFPKFMRCLLQFAKSIQDPFKINSKNPRQISFNGWKNYFKSI